MAETLEKKNDDERKMHILISEITPEDPNFRHWDSDDLARFLTLFGVKSSLKTLSIIIFTPIFSINLIKLRKL